MIRGAPRFLRHAAPCRAFTLIEVLVVALILAIMAALVTPTLTNASAPLPHSIATLLEIDMRRASAEAVARMAPTVIVVGDERNGWWIAPEATPAAEIPGTRRLFGNGTLLPFAGYALTVELDGSAPDSGDAVLVRFDALGARDAGLVEIGITAPAETQPQASWTLEPQRTKFSIEDG